MPKNRIVEVAFLISVFSFPLLQVSPHIWLGYISFNHGASIAPVIFIIVSLSSDSIFAWLLVAFARAKWAAFHYSATVASSERRIASGLTIVIPAKDEPMEILETTILAARNQEHSPLEIVLIENSTDLAHQGKVIDLCRHHGIRSVVVKNRGTKAAALNDALPHIKTPFVAYIDSDVVLHPEFAKHMLSHLYGKNKVAYVQGPQADRNRNQSYISAAASYQQAYFYEYIAPGIGSSDLSLCVGTNCVFRTQAIIEVGGWPEDTVSEDVCMSWKLHRKGYKSLYIADIFGKGLAPETFTAFFRQRARHAEGACQLIFRVLNDDSSSLRLRFHYLLLASFPFVSLAYLLFIIQLLLVEGLLDPGMDATAFHLMNFGSIILIQFALMVGMRSRGYRLIDLLAGQGGTLLALPAYLVGIGRAFIGYKPDFKVTQKAASSTRKGRLSIYISMATIITVIVTTDYINRSWHSEMGALVFQIWLFLHAFALMSPGIRNLTKTAEQSAPADPLKR